MTLNEEPEEFVDVEEAPKPKDNDLSMVADLAVKQVRLEQEVADLEAQLKAKQAELKQVAETDLPNAILSVGLIAVPLRDGTVIEVVTKYHAGIPAGRFGEAEVWLKSRGDDDIIKRAVGIEFGRGEETEAKLVEDYMRESYPQHKISAKPSIHAQTLGAYVRNAIKNGVDIPHDVFGIFTQRIAKITKRGTGLAPTTGDGPQEF